MRLRRRPAVPRRARETTRALRARPAPSQAAQ